MGLADDLARSLVAGAATTPEQAAARGYPLAEQIAHLDDALYVHALGRSQYRATDRELFLIEALIEEGWLPDDSRELAVRMPPEEQPERESYLLASWRRERTVRETHREWDERAEIHGRYPMPDHVRDMFISAERGLE